MQYSDEEYSQISCEERDSYLKYYDYVFENYNDQFWRIDFSISAAESYDRASRITPNMILGHKNKIVQKHMLPDDEYDMVRKKKWTWVKLVDYADFPIKPLADRCVCELCLVDELMEYPKKTVDSLQFYYPMLWEKLGDRFFCRDRYYTGFFSEDAVIRHKGNIMQRRMISRHDAKLFRETDEAVVCVDVEALYMKRGAEGLCSCFLCGGDEEVSSSLRVRETYDHVQVSLEDYEHVLDQNIEIIDNIKRDVYNVNSETSNLHIDAVVPDKCKLPLYIQANNIEAYLPDSDSYLEYLRLSEKHVRYIVDQFSLTISIVGDQTNVPLEIGVGHDVHAIKYDKEIVVEKKIFSFTCNLSLRDYLSHTELEKYFFSSVTCCGPDAPIYVSVRSVTPSVVISHIAMSFDVLFYSLFPYGRETRRQFYAHSRARLVREKVNVGLRRAKMKKQIEKPYSSFKFDRGRYTNLPNSQSSLIGTKKTKVKRSKFKK